MKIAVLVIGILGMVLAEIGFVVYLLLPTITNNHVSRNESLLGIIPAVIVFFLGMILTIVSAILVINARKAHTS